jgi:serine/threonine-protein kinase
VLSSESAGGPIAVGDVVAGKYRVERVLGRGGMGVVVAAHHLQLDQLVALKLVEPSLGGKDDVAVERLLREARAAARLRSDHVARVLDVGSSPTGGPFIVMEYLQGADLAEILEAGQPFDVDVACDYVAQACDAVAEAHSLGIVHRDLKPENLFLASGIGGRAIVKVLDFGVSKVLTAEQGALTQTRAVVGSPLYMAPEQLRSARRADPRSDVWALGVVLYELLTKHRPFEAESLPDLCLKVANEPPTSIEQVRDDLPAGLVAIIARCLDRDPAARFAHAGELAAALGPFVPAQSRAALEGARRSTLKLVDTGASPALTRSSSASSPSAHRRYWMALAVALVLGGASVALASKRDGPLVLALAAVQSALTSSAVARTEAEGARPSMVAPPAPEPRPAAAAKTAPARPVATVPPRPRGAVVPSASPRPTAAAPRSSDDEIPAFR